MIRILVLALSLVLTGLEATSNASFEKGLKRMEEGRYPEAINSFNSAVKKEPGNAEILSKRGAAHSQVSRPHMAIHDFSRAIKLSPKNPSYYMQRAQVYSETGNVNSMTIDLIAAARLGDRLAQNLLKESGISW